MSTMPFPFLNLPPEIRLLIYEAAFKNPSPIRIMPKPASESLNPEHREWAAEPIYSGLHVSEQVPFPLLRANKQIYAEARDIFYRVNTFAFRQGASYEWCAAGVGFSAATTMNGFLASVMVGSRVPPFTIRSLEIQLGVVEEVLAPSDDRDKREWKDLCAALFCCTGLRSLRLDMVGKMPASTLLSHRGSGSVKSMSWARELLEVFRDKKLQELALRFVLEDFADKRTEEISRVAGFLEVLRSGLLDGGEELGKRGLVEVKERDSNPAMEDLVVIECIDIGGRDTRSVLGEELEGWERCNKSYAGLEHLETVREVIQAEEVENV